MRDLPHWPGEFPLGQCRAELRPLGLPAGAFPVDVLLRFRSPPVVVSRAPRAVRREKKREEERGSEESRKREETRKRESTQDREREGAQPGSVATLEQDCAGLLVLF